QKPFGGRREEFGWYQSVSCSGNPGFPNTTHPQITLFPNSGFAVATNTKARIIFTAIPNGIGGKGSHTHNDKLSVIASVNGYELLVDSGTGCYTRAPELRNRLRSTAAHNTVMIDEEEQNRYSSSSGGLFRMGNDAQVSRIAE